MTTTTHAERIAQATVKHGNREVSYTWKNPLLDKDWDGTPAGEQVTIDFRHDSDRKQYTATIRLVWWQPNERGFTVTMFAPFDNVNFPASRFHNEVGVARYSEKAFTQFQADTLSLIADFDPTTSDTTLAQLLRKIDSFSGGAR